MDFFEIFPQLRQETDAALQGRALRLIALAALPYDGEAFYFELRDKRYWVRGPQGMTRIGMGGAQVSADGSRTTAREPARALLRHLRDAWHTEARSETVMGMVLLEGERCTVLAGPQPPFSAGPHWLILTPPQLGGGEMPDALVQAVYLLSLRRLPRPLGVPGIVRVKREALPAFLEAAAWPLAALQAAPWAEVLLRDTLPPNAELQPVLSLRAMQRVWREGLLL